MPEELAIHVVVDVVVDVHVRSRSSLGAPEPVVGLASVAGLRLAHRKWL